MDDKPCSHASLRNRDPILAVLREHFAGRRRVLEIGSGTGQHAVHFAEAMPELVWQASDRAENLPGIRSWLDDAALPNTPPPLALDVAHDAWPDARYDAAFSANTLHIMSWDEVVRMLDGLGRVLEPDAVLALYGPFNIDGRFTSDSNAAFDGQLRARAPHMGLRDAADVDALVQGHGFLPVARVAMPANNLTLVWRRSAAQR